MKKTLTPSWELFNKSAALLRDHYLGVIYLVLLPSLVSVLGQLLLGELNFKNGLPTLTQTQIIGLAIMFVSAIWQLINAGPLAYFSLRVASGTKPEALSTYYREGLRFTPRLFAYYIAFGLQILVGLLLFIVPAFYVLRRNILGPYYLVDADLGVRQALNTSAKRSKAVSGAIWGVMGVSFSIVLVVGFLQITLSSVGLLLGQLLLCTTVFLLALRYRDIEPTTPKKI